MLALVLALVELDELSSGGSGRGSYRQAWGVPCGAVRGPYAQEVPRYFSTHYICILQALNWVRPCAWVRLPFPRHLVSLAARARRSVGWALVLPEISTMGLPQGIFISACGCGSLTVPQGCPSASCYSWAPHGMIRMKAILFMRGEGQPRGAWVHPSSQPGPVCDYCMVTVLITSGQDQADVLTNKRACSLEHQFI